MMKIKQRWLIGGFLMSVCSAPVWADFGVVDQDQLSEYGNAQTGSFQRAILGGSPVTAQEQAQLNRMLPESDVQRYYGRLGLAFNTLTLDQLKNKSTGPDTAGAINRKRTSANQVGFEVAIGYIWSANLRGDLEYFANKNLRYMASPVLSGAGVPPRELNAQIKNNTLLANAYYEFSGIYRFKPYLTGGIGAAVNSVQTTLLPPVGGATSNASNTQRTVRLAWGLGAGMRFGIFSRWFVDVSYRYVNLGTKLAMQNQTFKIIGNSGMNVVNLGFIYLF
jgi:opacity protein-like surface antigen